jgi:zinc/manganese transport system ATP-binding protein
MTAPAIVSIKGACTRLSGREIWHDVDLEVLAGEFVAVLGPNGVGKSTMLKVILGLQPLVHGQVDVLGHAPGEANDKIGYLPQRRTFDASLRVRGRDIVRLGVDGTRWGLPLPGAASRRTKARVQELIELVGAEEFADRPIGQVSGGEQLRW